jgi:spore coat polysaccharide biosynthesis protein SpsF (cytidylyltransferase family)
MTTALIVQARMTSTRLPGKALRPLGGKYNALRAARYQADLAVRVTTDCPPINPALIHPDWLAINSHTVQKPATEFQTRQEPAA